METKIEKERRYQQEMYDKWMIIQLFDNKERIKDNERKLFRVRSRKRS